MINLIRQGPCRTLCRKNHLSQLLAGLFLLHLSVYSMAAEAPENISINADYMKLNIDTGYSVYTGNVKIAQGDLVLTGDNVTLEQNDREIKRITVTGKPARYKHVTEKGENIEAESEHMVYAASKHTLVMTINARLKQPDHQVSSQKITYDTQKRIIIAGDKSQTKQAGKASGSEEKQRVNITLTPQKQPQATDPAPVKDPQPKK